MSHGGSGRNVIVVPSRSVGDAVATDPATSPGAHLAVVRIRRWSRVRRRVGFEFDELAACRDE